MRKSFVTLFLISLCCLFSGCTEDKQHFVGMPNPWHECNMDLDCGAKYAGFKFPVVLSNYEVRAMDGIFEVRYPLDEFRNVIVRKSNKYKTDMLSGVYIDYPINKEIKIKNEYPAQIRGTEDKIYVLNIHNSKNYYSAYCEKGMSLKEAEGIFEVLKTVDKF